MDAIIGMFLCSVVGFVLLVGGIVWLFMRGIAPHEPVPGASPAPRPGAPVPQPRAPMPQAADGELEQYAALDKLVVRWASQGRLDAAAASRVRDLIADEWQAAQAARGLPAAPATGAAERPAPARESAASAVSPVAGGPAPAGATAPTPPVTGTPALASVSGGAPLAAGGSISTGVPASGVPGAGALPPRLARPSLGAALLALGTRRTLLFLGAFLLIMSSLTLVVFNWASLPPIVQLAILAGTTAAVWAGGAWMARRPELTTAGRNLQVIAALLMPVVGFALGRPGLLDLAPRPSWQLSSVLSLVVYLVAAWRTRRAFYGGAAALGAASLALASVGDLALSWQPAPLIALFAALLPVTRALRRAGEARLAQGPRWVALVGGPLALAVAGMLYLSGEPAAAFATSLALAAVFAGLAYWLDGHEPWLWGAIALPAAALQIALLGAQVGLPAQCLSLALSAVVYLALCVGLEGRFAPALRPLFVVAMALGLMAGPGVSIDNEAARMALPPLVLMGAALVALVEGGRLAWARQGREPLATVGLVGAASLLFFWLAAMLHPWLSNEQIGLALLPLAGLYLAGARWWPGRLRPSYDAALQVVGSLIAATAWGATIFGPDTRLAGTLLAAAIFGGQAAVRRLEPWAAVSLGALGMAVAIAVERYVAPDWLMRAFTLAALAVAYVYTVGGERLRRAWPVAAGGGQQAAGALALGRPAGWTGRLAYWSWPGVILGAGAGAIAAGLALLLAETEPGLASGVFLGLAALLGLHTALWRRPELGYGAAPLAVAATMVAAGEGFFTGWSPAAGDLAYVVCALALGLALLGQGLRRFGRAYGLPYEQVAFVALPAAPLLATGDPAHLSLTWGAMALLYGAALWRYRLPWLLALAFVAVDWALLHGAAWLLPAGNPAGAGLILGSAVAAQGLFGVWARWRPGLLAEARRWGYLSAALGALGALALAAGDAGYLAEVAGMFVVVLAVLVSVERREELAWAALLLLALALTQVHRLLGLDSAWLMAWLVLELVGVSLAGWALSWLGPRLGLGLWRRATGVGAAGLGVLAAAMVAGLSPALGLPPLTFALASLGVLLVTVAVRERELYFAYAAGASLVGAILCQLADWGFSEPQWYVVPAGLYLLALAWGLRHFQGQRLAAQVIEAAASVLLLGLTFGQAVLGPGGPLYSLLLFGEALAVAGYGALARLRAPFVGGVGFFVLGAVWIAVDAAQLVNQWVLLGAVGLLMVVAYVILERHQERLARAGRAWAAQLQSWS